MELYRLHQPQASPLPVVANLPHSGTFVPQDIAAQFTPEHRAALWCTDWHLDALYKFLPGLGVTVLQATHSRYVVDLNRSLDEPRLGPFWSSVVAAEPAADWLPPVYLRQPTLEDVERRIETFYLPYHRKMQKLLDEKRSQFGRVYLLDLHSYFNPPEHQVVLGDRWGQTCSESLIGAFDAAFGARGYHVGRNTPYSGGYITQHYGKLPGMEALQIEVRKHLYLKEEQLDKPEPPQSAVEKMEAARQAFQDIFTVALRDLFPK